MPDIDRPFYEAIRRHSSTIDVPGGDVTEVMARGTRRRRRNRIVASGAAVALAASVTGAVLNHSGASHRSTVIDQPSATPPPSSVGLTWRTQPLTNGLFYETSLTGTSSGSVYAVSTGPGQTSATPSSPQFLYRSTDGAQWSVVTTPPGLSLAAVAVNGSDVYSVGTGPATSAGQVASDVTVARSSDAGGTWAEADLHLDLSAPAGALTVGDQVIQVAAGPKGVEAVVGALTTLDLQKALPSGVTLGDTQWAATPQGVQLLGALRSDACPAGESVTPPHPVSSPTTVAGVSSANQVDTVYCYDAAGTAVSALTAAQAYGVTSSYTWDQLGVSADAATLLQGGLLAFYSPDGTSFQQLILPDQARSSGVDLAAGPEGFSLATDPEHSQISGAPALYLSADGKTWTAAPGLPGSVQWVSSLGYLDGRLTAVTTADGGTSGEVYGLVGNTWVAERQTGQVASASFGPLGLAITSVAESSNGGFPAWQVDFTRDGTTWVKNDLSGPGGSQVENATVVVGQGSIVVTVTRPPLVLTGPADQVAVIGTPTGA